MLFPVLSTRGKSRFILKRKIIKFSRNTSFNLSPPTYNFSTIYCTSVIKLIRVVEVWGLSNCCRIILIVWSSLLFSEGQTMRKVCKTPSPQDRGTFSSTTSGCTIDQKIKICLQAIQGFCDMQYVGETGNSISEGQSPGGEPTVVHATAEKSRAEMEPPPGLSASPVVFVKNKMKINNSAYWECSFNPQDNRNSIFTVLWAKCGDLIQNKHSWN